MPQFSDHAIYRLERRGVSQQEAADLIYHGQPFRYFHEGREKLGYYDPVSRLFIGMVRGEILTVIKPAGKDYIERLKGTRRR